MPTVTTSGGAGIHHIGNATDGPPVLSSAAGARARRAAEGADAPPGWEHRAIAMDPRAYGELEKVPFGHRMARRAASLQDLVRARLRGVTAVGWSCGANDLPNYWELSRS